MYPRLKSIHSPDLKYGAVPENAEDCYLPIEAEIGPSDEDGGDIFSFEVVTPKAIRKGPKPSWLRGYLLLPVFSWSATEDALDKLLMQCSGSDWKEVATKISRNLSWEFEDYVPLPN